MSDDRYDHFGKDGSERPRKRRVVDWTQMVTGLNGLDPAADYEIHVRREVIPIIVVPGLFGTRLESVTGSPLWEPSTSLLPDGPNAHRVASTYLRLGGLWSTPEERMRLFGEGVQVADEGADNGWRSLCADSYGECLRRLERWPWSSSIRFCFQLPVHGFGYDWTADQGLSGERLARYVDELVESYRAQGQMCERVFLVTHGAGGLVARVACALPGASARVMGIFHAGLPAHGTPAVYHALKAGFRRGEGPEGMAADLLGHTGQHVSALAGCMPGLLQLLPGPGFADAQGGRHWLRFEGPNGARLAAFSSKEVAQGAGRYWGLPSTDPTQTLEQLHGWHHENSYLALGRDLPTAEYATFRMSPRGRRKKFGRLTLVPVKRTDADTITEGGEGAAAHRVFGDGSFTVSVPGPDGVTLEVKLQAPEGDGDGMVPFASALAGMSAEQHPGNRLFRTQSFPGAGHFGLLRHELVLDYLVQAVEQTCLDHMAIQVAA